MKTMKAVLEHTVRTEWHTILIWRLPNGKREFTCGNHVWDSIEDAKKEIATWERPSTLV